MIGLFPAAGHATRLQPYLATGNTDRRGSKEIAHVTDLNAPTGSSIAVGDYLIESYSAAGIQEVLLITREEKADLLRHYAQREPDTDATPTPTPTSGSPTITPVLLKHSPSPLHTIDYAYDSIKDKNVALGFPDIIMRPRNVFAELASALTQQHSSADVILGLFPVDATHKFDMVAFESTDTDNDHSSKTQIHRGGNVTRIEIKPRETTLSRTWACAVWRPTFSEYLHHFVQQYSKPQAGAELHIGDAFIAAMQAGLTLGCVDFSQGRVLDVGTPDDLQLAKSHRLTDYFASA